MGAETAIAGAAGALVGGSALYGARQSHKASKRANREAAFQQQQVNEDRRKTAEQQTALSKKVEQQQRKVAAGQARNARSRLRGGVFGESEPTIRNLNPNLG